MQPSSYLAVTVHTILLHAADKQIETCVDMVDNFHNYTVLFYRLDPSIAASRAYWLKTVEDKGHKTDVLYTIHQVSCQY